MAAKLKLTFSSGDYESIRALKEGAVTVEGVDLDVRPSIKDRRPNGGLSRPWNSMSANSTWPLIS